MALTATMIALGASSYVYGATPPPQDLRCAEIARFEQQFVSASAGATTISPWQRVFRRRVNDRDADVFYLCDGDQLRSQAYFFDEVPEAALGTEIAHHKRMLVDRFGQPCLDWGLMGDAKRTALLAEDAEIQRNARFTSYWELESGVFMVLSLSEISGAPRVFIEFKRQFDLGRNPDGTPVRMPSPCGQAR